MSNYNPATDDVCDDIDCVYYGVAVDHDHKHYYDEYPTVDHNDATYADDAGIQHRAADDGPGHVEHNEHHEPGEHIHIGGGDRATHVIIRREYVVNLRTAVRAYYDWANDDTPVTDPDDAAKHRTLSADLLHAAEHIVRSLPPGNMLTTDY